MNKILKNWKNILIMALLIVTTSFVVSIGNTNNGLQGQLKEQSEEYGAIIAKGVQSYQSLEYAYENLKSKQELLESRASAFLKYSALAQKYGEITIYYRDGMLQNRE